MAELDNLLGCRISIITMADARYEGVLFSINAQESSVVLRDVSLITENGAAPPEPFVSFPGNEIKDLCVHDITPEMENEIQALPSTPPVNVEVLPPAPPATNNTNRSANTHNRQNNASRGTNNRNYQQNSSNQNNRGGRGGHSMPAAGTGEHLLKLRVRQVHGAKDENQVINGEFDFETSLGSFNKEEIMTETAVPTAIKTYEKDDFFDNLSCDTLDRQEGRNSRITSGEERKLNQDTFGAIALHNNNYRYNYHRNTSGGGGGGRHSEGGGRGGRGGGYYRGGGNGSWRGRGRGRGRGAPATASS